MAIIAVLYFTFENMEKRKEKKMTFIAIFLLLQELVQLLLPSYLQILITQK